MRYPRRIILGAFGVIVSLAGCTGDEGLSGQTSATSSALTSSAPTTPAVALRRVDHFVVTCGPQIKARGEGAAPNEIVKVRIREQVPGGIDISDDLVADDKGIFIMGDYCDPKSPNAEVPALWSYEGVTSGRTGSDMIQYKLPSTAATTVDATEATTTTAAP